MNKDNLSVNSTYSDNVKKEKLEKFKAESKSYLAAKDIMTPHVLTLFADDSIYEAIDLFMKEKISAAIVIQDNGEELGVFSGSDIARFEHHCSLHIVDHAFACSEEKKSQYYSNILKKIENQPEACNNKVVDWMTPDIISVKPFDSLSDCCTLLIKKGIHRVFVKDEEKTIGVISNSDIVKLFIN